MPGFPLAEYHAPGRMPACSEVSKASPRSLGVTTPVRVFRIDHGRKRKSALHFSIYSGRTALFFGMHFRGFAVAIFQEVMKKYDHLLSAPDLIAQKLGRGLQACTMPLDRVSEE